jgi:UDP-glucose:(heptosyl)LPS alpha-1,3-glucosyltransferase
MKIVIIRQRYTPFGGAELHLGELGRALVEAGHQVRVVAQAWSGPEAGRHGFELVLLGRRGRSGRAQLANFCRAASLWLAGPGQDRDVAISADRVPGVDAFWTADGCHAAWLRERSRYAPPWRRWWFRLSPLHRTHLGLERAMLTHPDLRLVIANSEMVRRDLLSYYGLDPDLVRVAPSGVDRERVLVPSGTGLEVRAELNLGDCPIVLYVGSNFKRKGFVFALQALARMTDPRAVLVAVGRDRPAPYQRLAESLGLKGRVRFLGLRSDVPRLLAAADVFALPTLYDPGAISCLEALVAGTPVVTTQANGSAEAIEPGRSGFVVERADDIIGLARALDQALALKARLISGQSPIPTLADHVQAVIRLLQAAADRPPRPAQAR